jgi:hypothetical protein
VVIALWRLEMRNFAIGALALAVAGFVAAGLSADDKKEVTLRNYPETLTQWAIEV